MNSKKWEDVMTEKISLNKVKSFAGKNSAFIAFVALFLLAAILKGNMFFSYANLINILRNNAVIGIVALGMTIVIIAAGIDLSVGSMLAFVGYIVLLLVNQTQNIVVGITAGCLMAAAFGLATGYLVSNFRIPAFIVTLGTLTIYRSVCQYFLKGGGVTIKGEIQQGYIGISNTNLFGIIPLPIIYWLICAVVIHYFMMHTPSGRHIYAVGSNEKATLLSGVHIHRVKWLAYSVAAVLVAVAAIVETSRLGSVNSSSSGSSYEMDAIAAAVIGGASMSGGKGRVIDTVFGTLTLGIINNMMNLMGVNAFLVGAVKGVIIIVAVLLQTRLNEEN